MNQLDFCQNLQNLIFATFLGLFGEDPLKLQKFDLVTFLTF